MPLAKTARRKLAPQVPAKRSPRGLSLIGTQLSQKLSFSFPVEDSHASLVALVNSLTQQLEEARVEVRALSFLLVSMKENAERD